MLSSSLPRLGGSLLLVAAFAGGALGAVPKTWSAGETLSHTELNANFKALDDRLAAVEAQRPLASFNGKTYSLDAIYCGATPPSLGNLGGHTGAKAMCEFACKSPSAHMCIVSEMQRSYALGKTSVSGWITNSYGSPNNWAGIDMTDCEGWTNAVSNPGALGSVWSGGPHGYVGVAACYSATTPVLCCD